MSSLDWVNDRIKVIKKQIKKLKDMIKSYSEKLSDSDNDTQVVSYLCLSEAKDKLQEGESLLTIYQQIKSELEAWEICKNKLNLKVQTEEAVTEGFCMKGYWLLVEQYPYTQTTILEQEEYDILKKALEVENE
jgi:hypothetical protein